MKNNYFPVGSYPSWSADDDIDTPVTKQIDQQCESCLVMMSNPKPVHGVPAASPVTLHREGEWPRCGMPEGY